MLFRSINTRKRLFIPFLVITCCSVAVLFLFDLSERVSIFIFGFALYIAGYYHGRLCGREQMKDLWEFAHPNERYNLDLIQEAMYDKANFEYYQSQNKDC